MCAEIRPEEQKSGRSFIERARREQIVACAIDVLAEYGYAHSSLALIAKRAGISKGVISYHFAGKTDLLHEVMLTVVTRLENYIWPRVTAELTSAGKLRAYIRANIEYMRDHRADVIATAEVYMNARTDQGQPMFNVIDDEPLFSALTEILSQGQRDGEFGEFDPSVMAVTIQTVIDGVHGQWTAQTDLDLNHIADEVVGIFERATRMPDFATRPESFSQFSENEGVTT